MPHTCSLSLAAFISVYVADVGAQVSALEGVHEVHVQGRNEGGLRGGAVQLQSGGGQPRLSLLTAL